MAVLISPDRKIKSIHNLGWLLKHWSEVECFEVEAAGTVCLRVCGSLTEAIPEFERRSGMCDCVLVARLKGGSAYATAFADHGVLLNWLHRPVFYSLRVTWFGVNFVLEQNSAIHKKARGG